MTTKTNLAITEISAGRRQKKAPPTSSIGLTKHIPTRSPSARRDSTGHGITSYTVNAPAPPTQTCPLATVGVLNLTRAVSREPACALL